MRGVEEVERREHIVGQHVVDVEAEQDAIEDGLVEEPVELHGGSTVQIQKASHVRQVQAIGHNEEVDVVIEELGEAREVHHEPELAVGQHDAERVELVLGAEEATHQVLHVVVDACQERE